MEKGEKYLIDYDHQSRSHRRSDYQELRVNLADTPVIRGARPHMPMWINEALARLVVKVAHRLLDGRGQVESDGNVSCEVCGGFGAYPIRICSWSGDVLPGDSTEVLDIWGPSGKKVFSVHLTPFDIVRFDRSAWLALLRGLDDVSYGDPLWACAERYVSARQGLREVRGSR